MSQAEHRSLSELGSMDRVTQTADCTDELVRIMYSSIAYLTRKGGFKVVNPDFPITQSTQAFPDSQEFQANVNELVSDFIRKAKQIEYLISALPSTDPQDSSLLSTNETNTGGATAENEFDSTTSSKSLEELEQELVSLNHEYKDHVQEAENVRQQIRDTLSQMLMVQQQRRTTFSQ